MEISIMKEKNEIPKEMKIFLWVGRFHHEKRPQVFAEASRILVEKGIT
jgi:glycosyltransferase involved in cell wall biosynthesis